MSRQLSLFNYMNKSSQTQSPQSAQTAAKRRLESVDLHSAAASSTDVDDASTLEHLGNQVSQQGQGTSGAVADCTTPTPPSCSTTDSPVDSIVCSPVQPVHIMFPIFLWKGTIFQS